MKIITSVVNSPAKQTRDLKQETEIKILPLEATMFMYAEESKQIFLLILKPFYKTKGQLRAKCFFKSIE